MSDTSQGPDWWQASDGKWYPPQEGSGGVTAPPAPDAAYSAAGSAAPAWAGAPPYGSPAGYAGPVGKARKPLIVLLLSIVTLGIYSIYWHYKIFEEMKLYSNNGIGGILALIIALVFSPVLWFVLPSEVGNLYAAEGKEKPVQGKTGFWVFLPFVGFFIWLWKCQGRLNDFWYAHGAPQA
jgi:hypothetical protein